MNKITEQLLKLVSNQTENFEGAYNIREDGGCAGRRSTEHIKIESKTDKPGLDIIIAPGTSGESVSIPACITHANENDLVYNDFHVGENADVLIIAGCGIHTSTGEAARHNGIHRFFLAKGAKVKYVEKHIGIGDEGGLRFIDPVTEAFLEENAVLEMDTAQIGGVDSTVRKTAATLAAGARLFIRDRIFTDRDQTASADFTVELNGEGSGVDLISRSVASGHSNQSYHSTIIGNAPCTGHSECDAIISEHGTVDAVPQLRAYCEDASLIHEAAIGKIAGEQIMKLRTLGLTEEEAQATIIAGFLS